MKLIDSEKVRQIQESLREFWSEQSLHVGEALVSVDDLVAAMDSMTAVDALIGVEAIVGMELPTGEVIRIGGYANEEQFVEHLTARVCRYVEEHT